MTRPAPEPEDDHGAGGSLGRLPLRLPAQGDEVAQRQPQRPQAADLKEGTPGRTRPACSAVNGAETEHRSNSPSVSLEHNDALASQTQFTRCPLPRRGAFPIVTSGGHQPTV